MALLNNFSVLPWYEHTQEQDFRKWWKYGRIYPLYTPVAMPPASQILRTTKRTGYNIDTAFDIMPFTAGFDNAYIDAMGMGYVTAPRTVTRLAVIPIGGGGGPQDSVALILTYAERYGTNGRAWAILDSGYSVLWSSNDVGGQVNLDDYYPNAAYVAVQVNDTSITNRLYIADSGTNPLKPRTTFLRTVEGDFVANVISDELWNAVTRSEGDYLLCIGNFFEDIPIGQYYLEASDGTDTWYSDVFTAVADEDDLIKIRWRDEDDFIMDAGRIVYKEAGNAAFINYLYLRADIAKPEYNFEEEGETRDGVFYPVKQISSKKYSFHFFAPEYLLDVMRLIRMADEVTIIYRLGGVDITLHPTTFLLTPEWEREGDLAGVTVEFETNTVAKKVGLAYIREA